MTKRLMQLTGVLVTVVALTGVIAWMTAKTADAAVAAPVQVVNTPGNPIPVTGALSGQVTLDPSTPVTIGNNASNPVLIRDVDGAREPVQANADCSFTQGSCTVDVLSVPGGKRLVVQHVSGNLFAPSPKEISILQLVQGIANNTSYTYPVEYLAPTLIGTPNGAKLSAFNHETQMVFFQGQIVRLQAYTNNALPGGYASVFISGYYTQP